MATNNKNKTKNVVPLGQMSFCFLNENVGKDNKQSTTTKKSKMIPNTATAKNKNNVNPLLYYPPKSKTQSQGQNQNLEIEPPKSNKPTFTITTNIEVPKEKEIEPKMEVTKEKEQNVKEKTSTSNVKTRITKMELQELFEVCKKEVEDARIVRGNIYATIKVNSRFSKKWGVCRKRNGIYYIEVADRLLNADEISIKTTIIHEILHTVKGCMNHGPEWKRVADIMNRKYGYNIKRTTSEEEKGLEVDWDAFKYIVKCKKCGHTFGYTRKTKCIQYISQYRCAACKGHLEIVKGE